MRLDEKRGCKEMNPCMRQIQSTTSVRQRRIGSGRPVPDLCGSKASCRRLYCVRRRLGKALACELVSGRDEDEHGRFGMRRR